MSFNIGGVNRRLRGCLTVVAADNLASQLIGGFKVLNSALRKCRQNFAVKQIKVHVHVYHV